jgi:hypothetical protein
MGPQLNERLRISTVEKAEQDTSKKANRLTTCFVAGILLGLLDPEYRGEIFLRNVGRLSTDYAALYPRR